MEPYYVDDSVTLYHGRCEDVLPQLPPGTVDVLLTDPPYFNVKDEDWDRQWAKADQFLGWLGEVLDSTTPLLTDSASVWMFASPALTSRVEREVIEPRLRLLNSIRWVKQDSTHNRAEIAAQRRYFAAWEGLLFAEHKSDAYKAVDYEAHKSVFRTSGAYLQGQREAAGLTRRQLGEVLVDAGVYSSVQSATANISLQEIGSSRLSPRAYDAWTSVVRLKPYADLCRDYDGLWAERQARRQEYADQRRPFVLDRARGPVTDVWNFPSVEAYRGKHPCEKPLSMLTHMIEVGSRPGDLILDPFAGSGSTLRAAKDAGRRAIGIEMDERWCAKTAQRLSQEVFDFGGAA